MSPQTTGAMTFRKAKVEFGTSTADLTIMDGQGTAIAVSGGTREVDEANTFEGDFPIIGGGKLGRRIVEVRFLYSEATDEAFEKARQIHETEGGLTFLRFSPSGGDTATDKEYIASNAAGTEEEGIMSDFLYPSGEAKGGALIPGSFTVHTARLVPAAVGS